MVPLRRSRFSVKEVDGEPRVNHEIRAAVYEWRSLRLAVLPLACLRIMPTSMLRASVKAAPLFPRD